MDGEFFPLPSFLACHLTCLRDADIRRLFVPTPNVTQLRELLAQQQQELEVVGMDNLLDALPDIFDKPVIAPPLLAARPSHRSLPPEWA